MANIAVMTLHRELRCSPLSYPKLADEEASIFQAHAALLLDDLLDSLENVPGHSDIPTHVDVSSLLPQALVHRLWQLLAQCILYIFLTEAEEERWVCTRKSSVKSRKANNVKSRVRRPVTDGNKVNWSRIWKLQTDRLLVCPGTT